MTDKWNELKSFWGSSLAKFDSEALEPFPLLQETRRFLEQVGLPKDVTQRLQHALEINFYTDLHLLSMREYEGREYFIIGDDSGTKFSLDPQNENVYAIDFENASGNRLFVNSNIPAFLRCLQIFAQFQAIAEERPGDESVLVDDMKKDFLKADTRCLTGSTWWSIVVNPGY